MHPRMMAQPRPDGLTPFGRDFKADPRGNAHGLISTTVGFLDLKNPSAVLDRLPAEFKAAGPGFRNHPKGSLQDGVNIIQLDETSVKSQGYDQIASEVGRYGRVLGQVPDRGMLVKGTAGQLARLAAQPFVEGTAAYRAAFKLDPAIGQMPLIQASRAKSTVLDLQVKLWNGEDTQAAKGRLAQPGGDGNVRRDSME